MGVHSEAGAGLHLIGNNFSANEGLHRVLEVPPQRPGPVDGVVSGLNDLRLGGGGEDCGELLIGQALVQAVQQQVDDMGYILLGQGLVEDNFIQPVEELRAEGALQQLIDLVPGLRRRDRCRPAAPGCPGWRSKSGWCS